MQWFFFFFKALLCIFWCLWLVLDYGSSFLFFFLSNFLGQKCCFHLACSFKCYLFNIRISGKIMLSFSPLTSCYHPWSPPDPFLCCYLQPGSQWCVPPGYTKPFFGEPGTSQCILCQQPQNSNKEWANVMGWHRHLFQGALSESNGVVPNHSTKVFLQCCTKV